MDGSGTAGASESTASDGIWEPESVAVKNMYDVRTYASFDELPDNCATLVAVLSREGMFGEPEWFRYLMRRMFGEADVFRLHVVEETAAGRPVLLAPMRLSQGESVVPGGRLATSISHPENFTPAAFAFDDALVDRRGALLALFSELRQGLGGREPPCDALRIWPVDEYSDLTQDILGALRQAGWRVQPYPNSYNRYEATAGLDYETYFAARSANHRYNVRRRQRALERKGNLEFALVVGGDLAPVLEEYREVSLASWKEPQTMISLGTLELIEMAARKGALRLGILRVDGVAAAVQFWIVTGGVAHCARLAYHEGYKHLAVGVVLTNFMVRHVLDEDRADRIDFGYGAEDYKDDWMKDERFYFGLLAFNPRTWRGLLYGTVHIVGRPIKRLVKSLLEKLGLRKREDGPAGADRGER